jgi:hypothetical protein
MVLTVTKKVRKVKEEIVSLFPRPVFSSQIPPPPRPWTISGTVGKPLASTNFSAGELHFLGGWLLEQPNPPLNKNKLVIFHTTNSNN